MAARLRNEEYVAFLDESGETGLQVVAGVLIPARWLRGAERRWRDFIRDHLGSRSGRTEVKSRELLKGHGASLHAQAMMLSKGWRPLSAKAAGKQFYRDALEHVATINQVRFLVVGLDTPHAVDVYRLWFWLAYAALIERKTAPRPRLPLVVFDGEDAAIRGSHDLIAHRFHRSFWGRRYYLGPRGNAWFIGGSVYQDSSLLPFIQAADLVAAAARHAIRKRKSSGSWYETHLRGHALAMGREVDVSAHALRQLRQLTPKDAYGTGWPNAVIVP